MATAVAEVRLRGGGGVRVCALELHLRDELGGGEEGIRVGTGGRESIVV